jgi:aminoglycoside N3'-acetyltransferase
VTRGRAVKNAALLPILEGFGVPRDGVLVVHSAIARLSRNGFRAEAIIEALLDHLVDGNLFMPTMTWRTVTAEQPVWDEILTASHTGVPTEVYAPAMRASVAFIPRIFPDIQGGTNASSK